MGKNRDRLSIIAAILEATGSGAGKTRIMYAANLSFELLEKYLQVSFNIGFIEFYQSKYQLTEYGWAFLRDYRNFYVRYFEAQKLFDSLIKERERLTKLCSSCGSRKRVRTVVK